MIATAIPERLMRNSHVLNIRGESYRLKDKRQEGLLTSYQLLNPSSEQPNSINSQVRVDKIYPGVDTIQRSWQATHKGLNRVVVCSFPHVWQYFSS